jgi:hypothetical protein
MSEQAVPQEQDNKPGTMIHLNVNLDANDIVAIKVAKIENHCIATEQALQEEMKKLVDEKTQLNKRIQTLITAEGEKAFRLKSDKLALALTEFEGIKVEALIHSYPADQGYCNSCTMCSRNGLKDNGDKIRIDISFRKKAGDREERDLFQFHQDAPAPKQIKLIQHSIQEIDTGIQGIQEKLTKTRNAMAKISTLERHCRAQLASQRLQELGRQDILKSLDDVNIPGMPDMKMLSLPSPKKAN